MEGVDDVDMRSFKKHGMKYDPRSVLGGEMSATPPGFGTIFWFVSLFPRLNQPGLALWTRLRRFAILLALASTMFPDS